MKQQTPRGRRERIGPAAACCVLLASITGCGGSGTPPAAQDVIRPVKTLVVTPPGAGAGIELTGQIRKPPPVDLAFREVSGRISELPIAGREGEQVLKGELLAQIDPREFELALRNAEIELNDALSALDLAGAENERMQKMKDINPNLVSDSMLKRTRDRLEQAGARVNSLETRVERAEDRLEDSSLRAPFAATVVRRMVERSQEVKAGEPIVSIRDVTHLQVLVRAPQTTVAAVRALGPDGLSATVRFPSAPGTELALAMKETAQSADPSTGTFEVVLEMPTPGGVELRAGMKGAVTLAGEGPVAGMGRILIPAIAVLTDPDGKDYVWLVDPAELRVHRRDVRMGRLAGSDQVQILSGLKGDERIAVAGVLHLTEGQQVRLWQDQEPGNTQ
jgi:RND family efflux transporter MFP subunit